MVLRIFSIKKTHSMKNSFSSITVILFTSLLISCSTTKTKSVGESSSTEQTKVSDYELQFKASGNEPFWNVSVQGDEIVFSALGENDLVYSNVQMNRIMDVAGLSYTATDAGGNTIRVQIIKEKCMDTMADKESPYEVSVQLMANNQALEFKGCGNYLADIRLNQTWYLKELGGSNVKVFDAKKPPMITFDTEKYGVNANMGCNGIGGGFEVMENAMYFSPNFMSTLLFCEGVDKLEKEFSSIFIGKSLKYTFHENQLIFKDMENQVMAIFSKDL